MTTIIGTRKARLFLTAGPTEFTGEVSAIKLTSGETDSDFTSFTEAAAGGSREYVFELTIRQDTAAASLWYYAFNNAGDTVAYQYWPNGQNTTNPTTPTTSYPKFHGNLVISGPDGDLLGGEANASSSAVNTIDVKWKCTAKPTLAVS